MAISKTKRRGARNQICKSHTVLETAPKAVLLMLLTGLFLLSAATLFTLNLPSPIDFARPIALMSLLIAAAAGGFFCSKQAESPNSLVAAVIASALLILLLIIAKASIRPTVDSSSLIYSIIGYVTSTASAMTGVLLGNKTKRKIRQKKTYRS